MIQNSADTQGKVKGCYDANYPFLTHNNNLNKIIEIVSKTAMGIVPVKRNGSTFAYLSWKKILEFIQQNGYNTETKAEDIATCQAAFISIEESVERAMLMMMEKRIKMLVVLENSSEAGVLTFEDLIFEVQSELSLYFEKLKSIAEERNNEIDALLKLKEDYLNIAAHDLKSPLSIIKGFASLLEQEQNLNKEQKLSLHYIEEQCNFMLGMIDDLLTSASIEAGGLTLNRKPVSVDNFLEKIYNGFSFIAKKNGINFEISANTGTVYNMDESKMRECIVNLLDNAFKNTNKGSIKLFAFKEKQGIKFIISDTGKGFNKEEAQKLFDKYVKGKGEQIKGFGLGLYITSEIIKLHNGIINVESEQGKGTSFEIILP